MLEGKSQVTLKAIVDHYGLENGLSELVGYFSIASSSTQHMILDKVSDPVWLGNRKVNIPMIIYTNTSDN